MTLSYAINPETLGRFSVEPPHPISTPGSCVTCGTSYCEQGFVNPNLDFEFYGSVIICRTCVAEIAAIYGFITPEQLEEIQIQLHELRTNLNKSDKELTAAKGIIDGFSRDWTEQRNSDLESSGLTLVDDKTEPDPKFQLTDDKSKTPKSGSGKGRIGL